MPSTAPTVTSETVLTATTRSPASSVGPASGNSTVRKRRSGAYPIAWAASRASGLTWRRPSAVMGSMSASP